MFAAKADNSLETLNRITSQNGLTLAPEAQRGLQEISAELKTIKAGSGEPLSLASRKAISTNMAKVEESLAASGAGADQAIARQFSEFKSSVHDLLPWASVAHRFQRVAPVIEAPAVMAARADASLDSLTSITSQKGVTLAPEAQQSLKEISTELKAIKEGSGQQLSLASRNSISTNLAKVEESLATSGAGADQAIARQFNEFKSSVNDLLPANVAPIPAVAPVIEAPAVIAAKADASLDNLTRMTSQKGVTLAPEAQQSLKEISTELKAIKEGSGQQLSLAARNQISTNLAKVEESLATSGAGADAGIAKQFNQFKSSVNDLVPAGAGPIAPVTEAPAAIASRASENLDNFSRVTSEKGLALSPEAQTSMERINTQIKAAAQGTAQLTTQASTQLSADLANVERSLTAAGADDSVVAQFSKVKASVSDLTTASVERQQLASLQTSFSTPDARCRRPLYQRQNILAKIAGNARRHRR